MAYTSPSCGPWYLYLDPLDKPGIYLPHVFSLVLVDVLGPPGQAWHIPPPRLPAGSSVADPDPGSGAFLTPGSGIRNGFFPDP
jgi:hypothetical protein